MSTDTKMLNLLAAKVRELQRLVREKIGTAAAVTYVTTTVNAVDAAAMKKAQNLADVASVPAARGNILPAKTGQSLKVLRVNSGETDYELATITGGVTDHGALTGLGDDDHTQYHNDARGDARYDAIGSAAAAQAASQPLDSDLTAIAALSTTSFGRAFLALADAAAGRSYLALGTAATANSSAFEVAGAAAAAQAASQPLDSDLTAIAALSTTSFGRSFLALADAAAGRSYLALGTLATQSGTFSGTSSGTNTGDQDLSTLLVKASNLSDLASPSTARTNLGLGTAALLTGVAGSETAYGGTITWTAGAAPSGSANLRQFYTRHGNLVTWQISLTYAVTGTTITNISLTFPTEFPTPAIPTGFTGASVKLYQCYPVRCITTPSGTITNGTAHMVARNAADNGFEISGPSFTSGSYRTFILGGSYFTS